MVSIPVGTPTRGAMQHALLAFGLLPSVPPPRAAAAAAASSRLAISPRMATEVNPSIAGATPCDFPWWCDAMLTRTSRGLRTVRTGYAYQPPACCTYRRRRAAGAPPYVHALRVPALGVPDVARTVAP